MATRTGIVIQARVSSTRLPNKVLLPLPYGSGTSVLSQVIRRVKKVKGIDEIVVATTTDKADNVINEIAVNEGVESYKGSKNNVLERYFLAAQEYNLDQIIRITSDCPCIDAEIIQGTIKTHISNNSDYTSNSLKNKFPHGFDCEVIKKPALEKAYFEAKDDYEKEHVTPFIYKSHPELFKITAYEAPVYWRDSDLRITLDTPQDYTFLCTVYDYLFSLNSFFSEKDIYDLLDKKPWLKEINNSVVQKKKYTTRLEELQTAVKILELQELYNAKDILEKYIKEQNHKAI